MDFVPHTTQDQAEMLAAMGLTSVEDLFSPIPAELRAKSWNLPTGLSELEVSRHLQGLAGLNAHELTCFLGGGVYDHFIPAAVGALAFRSEFYTAYTPYQPETSQGTLQSIYEYQTAIARLTGLDASNASLYDGGTGLFEAAVMAVKKTRRRKIIVDTSLNPIYRILLKSYTANMGIKIVEDELAGTDRLKELIDAETAGVMLQNPDFFGRVRDLSPYFELAHENKALAIMSCYPIALGILKTPAEMGADIALGEGQPLGLPLSFGGPYFGFIAVTKALIRSLPGRIVGRTKDEEGRVGFCLTLQTREQHIRREKATSNICSNEALCVLSALVYLTLMGKEGLKELAELNVAKAAYARRRLSAIPGVELIDEGPWFNEFRLRLDAEAQGVAARMLDQGIVAGYPLGRYYPDQANNLLVAVTEKRTKEEINLLAEGLEAVL
ncbi:MAG: aminomethyl-transferring glycine dehydrogenase subunit GcvPA [Deltaproteobacteria bacterium]|nr:aminomethyl-transferring glycine dehydrogenase subunit GcvPA [Deltaproteobacteria bacterium]